MNCPFCSEEMREGFIPAGNQLKWAESGAEETLWGTEGVPLNGFFGGEIKGFFCPGCRRIILSVPEKAESMGEKLRRKLGAAAQKAGAAQKQWEDRRAEEKERKRKKNFGQKDPWEM